MKIVKQSLDNRLAGSFTIIPEDDNDIWVLYNVIFSSDQIALTTMRNIKTQLTETRFKKEKKYIRLKLDVQAVDYLPGEGDMRIKGQVIDENPYVSTGSFHTATVELNRPITIFKKEWDTIMMQSLADAGKSEDRAEIGAVVMEEGFAHVCIITNNMTLLKQKVEKKIAKKRRGDIRGHEEDLKKFYNHVYNAVIKHLDFEKLKVIIIASPGFTAENFYNVLLTNLINNKPILQAARQKVVVAHSSTGYLQGLEEAMADPDISKRLVDTKYSNDTQAMEDFLDMLGKDDTRAWYGQKEVEKAIADSAVQELLITDTLFRSNDIDQRKHFIEVKEQVENAGGKVHVLSSQHASGQHLDNLTGIAAILRYPMYDLDESDIEE